MSESDVKPGDAIFFNTGWSALWGKNNDKFNSGEPGIGLEIAKWVIDKVLCMTGGANRHPRIRFEHAMAHRLCQYSRPV